jgi:hypothetical protein
MWFSGYYFRKSRRIARYQLQIEPLEARLTPAAPTISSLSTSTAAEGSGDLAVMVKGTNFSSGAMVEFGGTTVTPASSSTATELDITIPASALAEDASVKVVVVNADMTTSAAATFTVTEAAFTNITSKQLSGFESTALSNVALATFQHDNGSEAASTFQASINWGDGSRAGSGTVSRAGSFYTAAGSHTYAEEGTFSIKITVTHDTGSASLTATATILEALLPGGMRGTADQRFISEVYHDLLNRPVDANGLAFWTAALNQGASLAQVVQGIENSTEYQVIEVQALYQKYLHRAADPGGLSEGVNSLRAGGTLEQLAAAIASSPEYFQTRGNSNDDGFLNALYADAFGRAVDLGGRATWDQDLASGATRAQVAAAILGTTEYHQVLVQSYYAHFLDRRADSSGLSTFAQDLDNGLRDEQVLAAIVGSNEYFNKTAT